MNADGLFLRMRCVDRAVGTYLKRGEKREVVVGIIGTSDAKILNRHQERIGFCYRTIPDTP
jgi:hypothetical protein